MQFKLADDQAKIVYIKFNDESAGKKMMQTDITARRKNWVPITCHDATFGLWRNQFNSCITHTKFPLKLLWAYTVCKVEGLNKDVISFSLHKQRSFNNQGHMYGALGRVTNLENMFLIGKYKRNVIKANTSAELEYVRLWDKSIFRPLLVIEEIDTSLSVALLNATSMKKHLIDIVPNQHLVENYLLFVAK